MDAEDSSDDEGFRPVEGKKRRKLGDADANGESLAENLLQNNKFGPLADNNNNNNNDAGEAGAGGAPAVPAPSKSAGKQKQPPLVVKNSTAFFAVVEMVRKCHVTFTPIYQMNRFGTKVTCFSVKDFDKLQARLKKNKVEFYTHKRRSERLHRVVMRGFPKLKPEEVKELLKRDLELDALEVHEIKRKKESTLGETPFIVLFPKGYTNLKKLSEKKVVANTIIRWEAYRSKKPHVTQCNNCLLLGHGTSNCHLKARCNKCGGSHKTEECKSEATQAKKCANCSGAHEALDQSCPKRAEFIRSRQKSSKPKPPARKAEKSSPAPAFSEEEFPPLPGVVLDEQNPQPGGSSGGTGSSAGVATKDKAGSGGSQDSTGTRGGADPKAGEEEVLYTWEEVWKISLEYSARLKNCKTRSDQVAVISYMARKYGSK